MDLLVLAVQLLLSLLRQLLLYPVDLVDLFDLEDPVVQLLWNLLLPDLEVLVVQYHLEVLVILWYL